MIFVGDTWPGFPPFPSLDRPNILRDRVVCANLETGMLAADASKRVPLSSFPGDLPTLADGTYAAVCLANNHVGDGGRVPELRAACEKLGLRPFGAGRNLAEALRPSELMDRDGTRVILLGFGWNVIGCRPAGDNTPGTAPLDEALILGAIRNGRATATEARIVLWLHWGYELDVACQPAQRALALRCLDAGADAIIGLHSHTVQAVEMVGGKVLAHSIGNWIMPHGQLEDRYVRFPDRSLLQVALEINFTEQTVLCHWFRYHPDRNEIKYLESRSPDTPPWGAVSDHGDRGAQAFNSWYAEHRRRSPGLPVFNPGDGLLMVRTKEWWIRVRHWAVFAIRTLQGRNSDRGH